MTTQFRRISAVLALALVAAVLSTVSSATTATAARVKIGSVLNLVLKAQPKQNGPGYRLEASWSALEAASTYEVKLTVGGTEVSSARTTKNTWGHDVTSPADRLATVQVRPRAGKRPGKWASASATLPDITAPTGDYGLAVDGSTATVTEVSLSDDVTPYEGIARSIDWGAGGGFETYPAGTVVDHTYAAFGRYVPRVRMVDAAGNETTLVLRAVVLGDTAGPTGAFTVSPQRAWTGFTKVRLTQVSLSDDHSPADEVVRTVDWGDGTVESWPTGPMQHVYSEAGSYTVRVVLHDEAGNETVVTTPTQVSVADDRVKPRVKPRLPKRKVRRVKTWQVLRGTATDVGTGVAGVQVKVIQRRATGWKALKAKRWVRAASKKAAWKKATARNAAVTGAGAYRLRVPKLRQGTLVYRSSATDRVGNRSRTVLRKQRLTRR